MTDFDEYLRAGLHEETNAVLSAAQRWRADLSTTNVLALRDAIDALADAYVAWNSKVEEFMSEDGDGVELRGGLISRKETT